MSHFVSQGGDFDELNEQLQQRSTAEEQEQEAQGDVDDAASVHSSSSQSRTRWTSSSPSKKKRQRKANEDNDGLDVEHGATTGKAKSNTNLTRTNSLVATAQPRPVHRHHHHHHHNGPHGTADHGSGTGIHEHVLSSSAQEHLRQSGLMASVKNAPRKLGTWDGVFMPVSLNILGIILFLRFGFILGQVGLLGALLLLVVSYAIDALTAMSVSAISTNGQVRGGGAYYLISRSLGPEFGGSIGLVFFLGQALNAAMNVLGFVESLTDAFGVSRAGFLLEGPWWNFSYGSICLLLSTLVCLVGASMFTRATMALAVVLGVALLSIPVSSIFVHPFVDVERGAYYTGWSLTTLRENLLPRFTSGAAGSSTGLEKENWQTVFGVLFPAVTGLLAGVSMSGDLRKPSKSIPKGTNWSLLFTFGIYVMCFVVFAGTIARPSFYLDVGIVSDIALSPQLITFGVLASTGFSALMGVMACGKILQAIARDDLLPVLDIFAQGTEVSDTPVYAIFVTWILCQAVLFVDSVNLIAQLVTMASLLTFGTLTFATLALKAGGAPSFRPSFRYWNIWTAGAGTAASFGAMFFTEPYAASGCIVFAIFLFSAIHILCPPKPWGDVTRNLNYHIVRKYLLRLDERKGRVTHWRPQILLLANNPRTDWNLIIFCNSLKKGALYVLGHVLKGEFDECLHELRKQHIAWLKLVDISGIKSFVNIIIARDEREGARSLILSCGLGGMRPNIVCLGFPHNLPKAPPPAHSAARKTSQADSEITLRAAKTAEQDEDGFRPRHTALDVRVLPTDIGRNETPIMPSTFVGIMEDALALQKALAIAYGFENMSLSGPSAQYRQSVKTEADEALFIDLWPVQIQSPQADQSHAWDTYTMVLQLGTILSMTGSWKNHKLRVSVFVEFEEDIEEERRRVRSLLDNLRVPASLRVFSLSSEQVTSYGCIVRGKEPIPSTIESALAGDPWWEALRALRKDEERRVREATEKRRSQTATAAQAVPLSGGAISPKVRKQTKKEQKMLGVSLPKEHFDFFQRNMRIGLAHPRVGRRAARQTRSSESESDYSASESEDGSSSDDDNLSDELAELDLDDLDWMNGGAMKGKSNLRRSRTYSTGAASGPGSSPPQLRRRGKQRRSTTMDVQRGQQLLMADGTGTSYGSMSSTPRVSALQRAAIPESTKEEDQDGTLRASDRERIQTELKRQEQIGGEGEDFGGKASSTKRRLLSVSEDTSATSSKAPSRRQSFSSTANDVFSNDEQSSGSRTPRKRDSSQEETLRGKAREAARQSLMQSKPLVTFNQLPNKAQYLILNELIRTNSSVSTSVVLTALPAPEPGTSQDPLKSLRYLQHLESLFGGGPPVLGVHAKQLTMTSAL